VCAACARVYVLLLDIGILCIRQMERASLGLTQFSLNGILCFKLYVAYTRFCYVAQFSVRGSLLCAHVLLAAGYLDN
jgi:hypothetical protein